jgi:hypothetical protein
LPVALIIAVAIALGGIIAAGGLLVIFIGIPVVLGIVAYPKFGIAVLNGSCLFPELCIGIFTARNPHGDHPGCYSLTCLFSVSC